MMRGAARSTCDTRGRQWWGNYTEEPLALAIRRKSPGTVER